MKIHVRDFQSLADTAIEVDGLTVIVGRTNMGKSALIRAASGALFNRPGDAFVRRGAKMTRVEITGAPVHGSKDTLDIVWEKGGGANRFEINGAKSSSVGKSVPQALLDAGYRTIDIGEREEPLRPQIAAQFDGPFLLGISGATVSDVLTKASRLDVLLRAGAACTRDLRSTRQLLGVRRNDLTKAEKVFEVIQAPALALRERTAALMAADHAVSREVERRARLGAAVRRRASLVGVVSELTPSAVIPIMALQRSATEAAQLRALAPRHRRLAPAALVHASASKVEYVSTALATAARAVSLRAAWSRWSRLSAAAARTLLTRGSTDLGVQVRAQHLHVLVPRRFRLRLALFDLQPRPAFNIMAPAQHVTALRPLAGSYRSLIGMLRQHEAEASAAEQDAAIAEADVHNALLEAGVCPVCEQVIA